jgi:hypothetical protein
MSAGVQLREGRGREAYTTGSTMARTLESLDPGTPVFAGETRIGAVRAVYTEGAARSAELLVVHWDARGEEVAVPTTEVETIDDAGVHLMRQESDQYDDLAPFDAERFPTMRKLR